MTFKENNEYGKRWMPGQSGNPSGRKPGTKSFKTRLLEMAEKEINYEDLEGNKIKTTLGEAVSLALYGKAVKNKDLNAIRMVMDHTEDKSLTIKGDKENPLEISNVVEARVTIRSMLSLAAKARASSDTSEDEVDFLS